MFSFMYHLFLCCVTILGVIMLKVTMQSVIMLGSILPRVIILSVIMPSVIMLSFIIMSVIMIHVFSIPDSSSATAGVNSLICYGWYKHIFQPVYRDVKKRQKAR